MQSCFWNSSTFLCIVSSLFISLATAATAAVDANVATMCPCSFFVISINDLWLELFVVSFVPFTQCKYNRKQTFKVSELICFVKKANMRYGNIAPTANHLPNSLRLCARIYGTGITITIVYHLFEGFSFFFFLFRHHKIWWTKIWK